MSGRGRGRGGWRGRGARGGGAGPQRLTDEDGQQVLDLEDGGPPKTFPEIELPPQIEVGDHDKIMLLHYRDSLRQFQASPYFLRRKRDAQQGFEDDAQGPGKQAAVAAAAAASAGGVAALALMALDPRYFPEELYSEKDKRQAARAAAGQSLRGPSPAAPGGGAAGDAGLARLLAARADAEQAAEGRGGDGGGGGDGAAGGAGEGDDEIGADEDHDSDSHPEDDDYYAGEHFDDDEGYDDDDGGGGDDACF
ncbi:hypothetical protein Rsub_11131 [Raphidocelis subcapitata]|uniref:DNA-directed RNA polymerase III subunit n=1 Tax=Raphidocelis subcapitata TaxID=307507 RepID=A0A2V0PJD9_9CHLO|nr:hypothetical protein Rsub_11131 [Raphidocelis subcapitata]|eukprot:GBF98020.1 hypothetical protein Rsub_11131 [Raphidocelis subcapitata]